MYAYHTGPEEGVKKAQMLTESVLMSNITCEWDTSKNIEKKR